MVALIVAVALLAQAPSKAMEYVRAHREADAALVAGKLDVARERFEDCLALSPKNATVAYARACVESRAANKEKALEWLERAVEWGYADAAVALWDADLAALRSEAKFNAAVTRMSMLAPKATGRQSWAEIEDSRSNRASRVLAADASGKHVVVARSKAELQLLDTKSGRALRSNSGKLSGDSLAVEFHPDGRRVFALTDAGKLHIWEISGESAPTEIEADPADLRDLPLGDEWNGSPLLNMDRTGERLLVLAGGAGGTSLVDARGSVLHRWKSAFANGEGGVVAWSPDCERIAWCVESTIRFADGRTGEPLPDFVETPSDIDSLAFSPDGTLLATGHEDGCARLWNLAAGEPTLARCFGEPTSPAGSSTVDVISISPDARWLACGMSDTGIVRFWELSTAKLARQLEGTGRGFGAPREPFQWSADSRRVWSCFPVPEELEKSFPVLVEQPFACLRIIGPDRAVAAGHGGVFAFDPRSGACLWTRPDLGRAGEIVHTSTGYFTTDLPSLEQINFRKYDRLEWAESLEKFATRLFDPKRVRASCAGVALVPVRVDPE